MTYKVLITDTIQEDGVHILEKAKEVHIDIKPGISQEELRTIITDYDGIIIRSGTQIFSETIKDTKKLKVIIRGGVGIDGVDVDACTKKGIVVMNTPTGNTIAATEHTIALLLTTLRNVDKANVSVKKGEWSRKEFMGQELFSKTIGIIGLGRIGSRVAARCKAFEMQVIAYDPYIPVSKAETVGVKLVSTLDELLQEADIITVHTPLTEETKGIIGKKEFTKMKKGVIIINCARGGIIDEEALFDALENGTVAKAAVDVFTTEPPTNIKIIHHPKVIVTPHIGANTFESQKNVAVMSANQMIHALSSKIFVNAVNLPFNLSEEEVKAYLPYMGLARKIASIIGQIHQGRIEEITLEYKGMLFENLSPLITAALEGIFSHILSSEVNYVNANLIAKERGIKVQAIKTFSHVNFENYLKVVVKNDITHTIAATMFDNRYPKIVQIDEFHMEATPSEVMLIISNYDKPGVIGAVATHLGKNKINIAEWHLGRIEKGGMALALVAVDARVDEKIIKELETVKNVIAARQVLL